MLSHQENKSIIISTDPRHSSAFKSADCFILVEVITKLFTEKQFASTWKLPVNNYKIYKKERLALTSY